MSVYCRKTIGIDLDDTLRATIEQMCVVYNKEYGTNITESDVISYGLEKSFPLCDDGREFFFHNHAKEVFMDAVPLSGAIEAFNEIKKDWNIVVITNQFTIQNKTYALEWLNKYDLVPDGVMFTSNKNLADIDLLIDDNPRFIMNINRPSLLVSKTHNKDFDTSRYINCQRIESMYSWVFSNDYKERIECYDN